MGGGVWEVVMLIGGDVWEVVWERWRYLCLDADWFGVLLGHLEVLYGAGRVWCRGWGSERPFDLAGKARKPKSINYPLGSFQRIRVASKVIQEWPELCLKVGEKLSLILTEGA